jgi:hypothetical protein
MMTSKYTSVAAHFKGLADASVLCGVHCPMQHVQPLQKPLDYIIKQVLSLYCPRRHRGNSKKKTMKNAPTLLAILMAMEVRRYNTTCIARWKRCRAMLDATDSSYWASIAANSSQFGHTNAIFLCAFSLSTRRKRSQGDAKAHVFNRGMTYQSDWKDLTKVTEYFVCGVKIACYCYNDWFLLFIA